MGRSLTEKTDEKIGKLIEKIQDENADVMKLSDGNSLPLARERAFDRIKTAEEIAKLCRAYPAEFCYDDDSIVTEIIEEIHDIRIGYTAEGWLIVRLPILLPKRKYFEKDYVREMVTRSAKRFFSEHEVKKIVGPCTIIFRYGYPADYPMRRMRDFDNMESKAVIDALVNQMLPSDGPDFCSTYYCASMNEAFLHTDVFIVPSGDFPLWLKKEPDTPPGGTEIFEELPQKHHKNQVSKIWNFLKR